MTSEVFVPAAFQRLIRHHAAQLTDADTRLLNVLTENPVRAAMENGKDVSVRAGVHPASAVRLARRLGFKGYPEFRAFLQKSLLDGGDDFENPAARMAARLVKAEEGGLLGSLVRSEVSALEALRGSVGDEDIRAFSGSLCRGRRAYIVGRGHAAALASLVALRLTRSGYDAVDLCERMHQFAETMAGLTKDDVVWIFAFRRTSPVIQDVISLSARAGATCLLLTDLPPPAFSALSPSLHHVIRISRGKPGESQSLVVPMTLANAVILDLAAIDQGRSLQALDAFRAFRAGSGLSAALL
ncbi:MurR/RpiR family transcriptional regulator [Rhizobium sp. SSA_523]|uniref:MurR/RpiR family transcriptional regulator n=1 Tax=Rhizobium sp. SSA_523 TaxID=2952477 RepID=UPI002090BCF4|nr:MurR/RpiR family transcriptional regulator [Rhizobium sp. SSA_523]MCO5732398.1 MurR/RpiR family transcriptional regulator [Rhizobium sp. SSA_523]WKC22456.1 MurR/RpiR family transcriptional regulator [Rhizobium sp. SSA_523]